MSSKITRLCDKGMLLIHFVTFVIEINQTLSYTCTINKRNSFSHMCDINKPYFCHMRVVEINLTPCKMCGEQIKSSPNVCDKNVATCSIQINQKFSSIPL